MGLSSLPHMLRLTRIPDAVLIKSYVDTAEDIKFVPDQIREAVAAGWLAKNEMISTDACQEVFDALYGAGNLTVASILETATPPEAEPEAEPVVKKKAPAKKKAAAKKAATK